MESTQTLLHDANLQLPKADKPGKKNKKAREATEPQGRKDNQGQDAVLQISELADKLQRLQKLKIQADEAKEDFSSAVKAVALKAGLLASVVRKVVAARTGDRVSDEKRKADQLSLVFEELGE